MFLFIFLQYKYKIDEVNAMSIFEESQKNPPKNVEYIEIFRESYAIIEKVKQNKNLFFEILDYSDYLYKYNAEQIFQMYSQNENASVVADFQTWKRLNNPIKKGQHSYKIIYQNESGFYQHLSVFDVSQTINPQYELYQWKMNEQRLEMLSMQLFQHPDFSQGVRQYYKMMNTHFDVDVVCGVADYLLSNKLKQNFHSENYEYLHSLIQNVETKDLTDTLNFVFEQNKGIISRVYQIQQELERMKDYEQRIDVFGNHAINSRRSEPDKISNVTKTETARTQEEVPGGIRRNDGFTASDSMGVRTVLRGGRDATLPSEEQYETRRPSIDAERTHASEVHAKAHANRTHGNDDVGGHYRVSDERSGEDERLGRRSETGNRESGDSEIRGGTQSNAELHGELSDSHVGEIDGTRTSESGVHARESDLHTADLSSERNLTDGRRATNRITQEKPIDSESSIIQTVTRTTSNTESIVSNIQADVDQSSTPAFSFTQNQLKEIAIEELQTNQVIVRQEIPYRVGEITDRGSVQIIGLTNLEDGKESKWYYFPAELVPIYVLDESVISEHMQEAAIIADDETFEAVKQTENTNDLSVYENGNFDDLQLEQIKEGLSRGLDVTIFADPKYDAGQMREIALGLEDGLDISAYADTKYNYGQMRHIRMGLKSGLDVSIYADTKFSAPQMGEIKQGLMFDLDVSQYANPSMDYREMNKIREELQQQAYLERANSLSEEAKHDSVEDTLSDLDGYIRLKPTEFYKGLDVVIDDETYQILDFEDHGNGIGTLSVRTSTSTTSFYESLERLEVYAKEEDSQRFAGKEREQEVLESNESVVETEESPISEERQHPTSTEQIELSPEQFYEGMKVTYQSEEYTIQSFENYGNGLGKLSLASDEKNATLFNSLKYMNGVFATNEEVAKFESQYQKDEFDGQTQSPEHSSFSMPLFQYISTTEEKTEVSDDWTLLSEDMRYKEVGENTFLIYPDGRYSENPVDIMTENGQLYYKEREAVSIIEPYEVNLFDFEENTPTNASIDVPIVDQEIVVPPISEKSVGDTKANEADQMQHLSVEKTDFQFTPDKLEGFYGKTPKERIADNLQAIRLLKTIEQEERLATPEEQEILAKYVGWGGLADLVDENKSNYQEERQDLKELLTPAEYASVRESVLTAYYTDPKIIQVIYEAIEKTGFKGGNILDPAMGTGNFFAAMPQEMKANSTLYGVELDSLTARLAKQLHQTAHIQQMGFENTAFNQGSFDLVVGNVPFADFKLRDEQTLNEYYIHDYFVKRSLDLVHSGGIVAVITSSGTMDKQDKSFRTELAKQADLVGMVRLPNTAFKAIAGTEVVTDILFFQKRPLRSLDEIEKNPPLWLESNTDQSWKLVSNPAFPLTMNEYLKENVLARQENSGKKWYLFPEYQTFRGGTYTFRTREGFDYLSNIREELIDEASGILFNGKANQEVLPAIDERIRKDVPLFTYFVSDNTIQYYDGESLESLPLKGVKKERLLGMIALREQVKSIIDYQQEESYKDEVFQAQLQTLNENYDSFIDKYGYLSDKGNSSLFSGDDYASLLLSIENEKDGKISKGDIFYRPTVRKKEVLIVQTPLEALNHSLSKKGRVDIDYMLSIYETTKEQLLKDLDDAIFDLPSGYETKEQYLSGDVKTKLAQAKQWAKENPLYEKHVRALESVQPEDLGVSDIHVELGARWIPEDVYKQFIVEVLEIPEFRFKWEGLAFRYSPASDNYLIGGKMQASNVAIDQTYGTARINALQILEKTLNYRKIKIVDTKNEIVDGELKKVEVPNQKETILAKAQQEKLKQRFRQWIFDNPERADRLLHIYNERFNRIRPRVYDGSYLNFESLNVNYKLYDHQKNVVARIIENGKALMAHEVGAGKTASMISAGMLMKEQGLIQKPLYVVPNHLTEQFGKELLQFYPTKKVLVTTKKDFKKENRKKFISRIATGDYDAIIIGHSQFEKINISKERREAMIEREIFEIQEAIAEAKREDNKSWTVKQMVGVEKKLRQRLSKLQNEKTKDTHLTFEQLGVDYLFVDEAHNYKNLYTYTKLSNVAGINTSESLRATDMYMKCQYLLEKNDGRGVTFATGTPISNSMSEFYVLQRYLQPELLQQMDLTSFDRWASTFGEITEALEIAPEGTGFRTRTRFAKFHNLPELMNGFSEIADIQTSEMLNLDVPKIKDGKAKLIISEPSDFQKQYMFELGERADKVRAGCDPSVDNMLKITNEAKLMAIDPRLLSDDYPIHTDGKLFKCAEQVSRIWEESKEQKSTQIIFSDVGTPKENQFDAYHEMKRLLIELGIPENQIAFIHDAKDDVQREALFEKVRTGEVRILLGSTEKLGTGTNVQHKLLAVHHLDVPWRPSDLTQRDGRIVRQGNENKEVQIYRYVAKDSFDSYLWQVQENKLRFINQIMSNRSYARSADDVDQTLLNAAEAKAIATGNPKILEKINTDKEVMTLQMLKNSYQENKLKMTHWLENYPSKQQDLQMQLNRLTQDNQSVVALSNQDFKITIDGKVYTDKSEALEALNIHFPQAVDITQMQGKVIGEYKGFKLSIVPNTMSSANLVMEGQTKHIATIEKNGKGTFVRMDNVLEAIPRRINDTKNELSDLEKRYIDTQAQIQKPFEREAELQTLLEKQVRINLEIESGENVPSSDDSTKEQPYQSRENPQQTQEYER